MTHESIINGQIVYLKSFEKDGVQVYVNIFTGQIERPAFVNPMRLSQKNMYKNEIDRCKLPIFDTTTNEEATQ